MKKFLRSFYIGNNFYLALCLIMLIYVLAFLFEELYDIAWIALYFFICLFVIDFLLLYLNKNGIHAVRILPGKLSNGDENPVSIHVSNNYVYPMFVRVIDEIPIQFQIRDFMKKAFLIPGQQKTFHYSLRPTERGEYKFGNIRVFTKSLFGLIVKRYTLVEDAMVPVYPSFLQMRKYELIAISNKLIDSGIKKIRRIGNTSEFDQIKDYVIGDELKTINWKATARKAKFMVNKYQDERSQQVYCIVDMGRAMKMPFEGMTLLDYSINASLVISNIAFIKNDKPGLVTFTEKLETFVPAERKGSQMYRILETLYNQETRFSESGYEYLFAHLKTKISQRSLLLLFTNFETINGMRRQLKYLRSLAKNHLLVVIFFENTELRAFLDKKANDTIEIYYKTIAEKFDLEKKLIVKELKSYGIQSVYTSPQNLTINTINKYLELKARGMI